VGDHRLFALTATTALVVAVSLCACRPSIDPDLAAEVAPSQSAPTAAYFSEVDGNPEIYTIRLDGTGRRRLTDNPAEDSYPSFSPDGSRLIFESDRDGDFDIYMMNTDGSDQVNLTNSDGNDLSSSWAPDGSFIVFVSFRDGETSEVYRMDPDGANQIRLTNNDFDDEAPHVSPDGRHILTESGRIREKRQIHVMNANGSDHRPLTDIDAYCGYPTWSPDATTITFDSDLDGDLAIFAIDRDGDNLRRLCTSGSASFANWAPDGSTILFTGTTGDDDPRLWTMKPDGSDWRVVPGTPEGAIAPSWNPAHWLK